MNLRHDLIECFVVRPCSTGHEFLLLRRSPGRYMAGAWYTVAGRMEAGETAAQTAMREETALQPLDLYCLDRIGSFYVPSQDTLWHAIIFCAIVPLISQSAQPGTRGLPLGPTANRCRAVHLAELP